MDPAIARNDIAMQDSPSSHVSPDSSTRLASKSPNPAANNGGRISVRGSIQKHTKSRSGCKTCKRRKVKCDERRPSCGNCLKHGSPCDFAALVSRPGDIAPVESVAPLNLLDLELLNNFTSSTCNTLSNNPLSRNTWKTSVVRRALSSEFVMRTILAVSATQIAQHRPNQKHYYLSHAMAYHDIASRHAISMMAEMHPDNLEDLWIFSVLTLFFALGSPRDTRGSPLQVGGNIVPEWIFLFNGVLHILSALDDSSNIGIVSPLLNHGKACWIASHQPEHKNANILHELNAHIDATVSDEQEKEAYAFAIQELRCQLSYMLSSRSPDIDLADVFVWHAVVADSFMPLLQQGRQEAVAIFAHSLVLLGTVASSRWMTGWDTFLLARAWDVLDSEHRLWIQWPIEEIGWMPPN